MEDIYNCEEIYDNEISPLMSKIIEICKKHDIPMIASFAYENDEENGVGVCTTHLGSEKRAYKPFHQASGIIKKGGHISMTMAIVGK